MSVRDGADRRVSFNTRDELGDKIDKLTVVMSKLAVKDTHERKPLKPQIYKSRGQSRSYGQGGYQARSDNGNRGYGANNSTRQNYIEATDLEEISEGMVDKIIVKIIGMKGIIVTIEIGVGQGKELLQGVMVMEGIEALAMIDLDQGPELIQIEIEQGATCAENMIILQEIALTLEKREI